MAKGARSLLLVMGPRDAPSFVCRASGGFTRDSGFSTRVQRATAPPRPSTASSTICVANIGCLQTHSNALDDTSLFPTSAITMEFWDDKAEPSILLAVKSACEAVRGNLVNGSSDSR